ncbi:hypothetical protein [Pseudomonas lalucatii]|nr:hypothetical protein [Pseudomonas lalucatii]
MSSRPALVPALIAEPLWTGRAGRAAGLLFGAQAQPPLADA